MRGTTHDTRGTAAAARTAGSPAPGAGSTRHGPAARLSWVTTLLALCLVAIRPAAAQRLPITSLTSDDGLVASQVLAVHQDSRGYLWFATSGGISRYDGVGFTNFTAASGLHNLLIYTILEDLEGNLWFGASDGVARYDGRTFKSYTAADGFGRGVVWASAIDAFGHLWFGTQDGGVSVFNGSRFRTFTAADGLAEDFVYGLHVDSKGHLWLGSRNAGVTRCRIEPSADLVECRIFAASDGLAQLSVRAIAEDQDGTVFLGTRGGGVSRFDGRAFATYTTKDGLSGVDIYALLVNNRNELVVGTLDGGITICELPEVSPCRTIGRANGLHADTVYSLHEDRELNLWTGLNNGVSMLATEAFQSFTDADGLPDQVIYSVHCDRSGDVWLGTLRGLARLNDRPGGSPPYRIETFTTRDGLPADEIRDVLRDSRGTLWVGSSGGLCRMVQDGGFEVFTERDGLASRYVLDIIEARSGDLWVGTTGGVTRVELSAPAGDRPRMTSYLPDRDLPGSLVYALAEDHRGAIWLGILGQGVTVLDAAGARTFTTDDGLPSNNLNTLAVTADGTLWAGTVGGRMAWWKPAAPAGAPPRFRLVTEDSGLDTDAVATIVEDGRGRLWLGTPSGAYLFDPAAAAGRGAVLRHFDSMSGLINNDVATGNACSMDPQGRIWFGMTGGATRYDPALDHGPAPAPPVTIERVTSGKQALTADFSTAEPLLAENDMWLTAAPFELSSDDNNLRFEFRGQSFKAKSAVRFQYRLVGFEPAWSAPGAESYKEYTNLNPGRYTFRVRAAGQEGQWSVRPAEVSFAILPAFWQTGWFRVAVLVAASLLVVAGHTARTRRIQARTRELEKTVADRTADIRRYAQAQEEHAQALEQANERIQDADRVKSEFLASMSHELRTPLNSIIGFSEILTHKLGDRVDPRLAKFQRNILDSGRHLLRLIDNVLDLSKIEAGQMEVVVEETDIPALVEGVRTIMMGYSRERNIAIVTRLAPDLPMAMLDAPKLKQILLNLLSNAVKFSHGGAVVEVDITLTPSSESPLPCDTLAVAVVDHGAGIRPEDQEIIFENFRQAVGGPGRPRGGTGLGLAIVRRFAELQGGRVTVESTHGVGSTFRVFLPVDMRQAGVVPDDEASSRAAPEDPGTGIVRPSVLVVEDDAGSFALLAAVLEDEGFLPVRARNGEEAVQMARKVRPALIVLDIILPDFSGWEVLKTLRADPETAHLPVVIVSVLENRELGFALGVDGYFVKPIDEGDFAATVSRLVPPAAQSGDRSSVLVIDDDPLSLELARHSLEELEYRVITANDGRLGIELAISERPGIIVLDLMMPEMSGFEVAQALTGDPRTADTPVILLTAKDLTGGERAALADKITSIVSKSATTPELVRTIRALEKRRRGTTS